MWRSDLQPIPLAAFLVASITGVVLAHVTIAPPCARKSDGRDEMCHGTSFSSPANTRIQTDRSGRRDASL